MAHPYKTFPDRHFWNRSVSGTPWADVFLNQPSKFKITNRDRVASAGSCFSQRISRHLMSIGYNYQVYEACHPLMAAKATEYGYGVFSCRYGNIYSTRQLRQLFDEALGIRPPITRLAYLGPAKYIDLMRPNIGETRFGSPQEAQADRLFHLAQVRRMIEQMEVFVFTLGLTETWVDRGANIVYGSHPGVFVEKGNTDAITADNLSHAAVVEDLEYVIALIQRHTRQPNVRLIFTVSPVGLAATHQNNHVLVSTSYSKAVLRAAVGEVAGGHPHVEYFPSYEIFALSQSFGQFLADDLREVNPRGVAVAMRAFEDMFVDNTPAAAARPSPLADQPKELREPSTVGSAADVECDEVANAFFGKGL